MNQVNFIKKWIDSIPDDLFKTVMRKAMSLGYVAPGFTAKSKRFPKTLVGSVTSRSSNRDKYNYEIIIQVINIMSKENPVDSHIEIAQKWLNDERSREQIEEQLSATKDEVIDNNALIQPEFPTLHDNNSNEIKELKATIKKLQEDKKDLKEKIKQQKYEYSELEKENKKIAKINSKNETIIEGLNSSCSNLESEVNRMRNEIVDRDNTIRYLKEHNAELRKFKENAPLILCIGVNSLDNTGGFNLIFEKIWNDDTKIKYIGKKLFEIWIIGNIEYYKMLEIKNSFKCKVIEYKNKNDVYDRLGR